MTRGRGLLGSIRSPSPLRLRARAALLLAVAGALAGAPRARAQDPAPAPRRMQEPRPFQHARHARLACTQCHGTGQDHGKIQVRTPLDCARCHHDPRREYACLSCHPAASLPSRLVPTPMALSVWPEERVRPLPFQHAPHVRSVECRHCHGTPVTLRPNLECRSCHRRHERPEADCAQCHRRTDPPAHHRESHLSCAGAACHDPALRGRMTMSRNLCLVCHTGQREHEPGRNCAPCHILSRPPDPLVAP